MHPWDSILSVQSVFSLSFRLCHFYFLSSRSWFFPLYSPFCYKPIHFFFKFQFIFFSSKNFIWLFFISCISLLRLSISLMRLSIFFVLSMFIITYWSIFMMPALKVLSDNFNIFVISVVASIDWLFQAEISMALGLMSDFLLKALLWDLGCYFNCVF